MLCTRIIPRLDIKGPNLVKGIHMEGLRVLGKPEQFAQYYYETGADELLYMDVVASLYGRNSLLDMINRTAKEIFIPLTVGGGLRTIEDIRQALRAGADKVALNTAAIQRPELIKEAAKKFGSSTIIVSIEAIKKADGSYEAYTENGRQETGMDAIEWATHAADLGAGEIMFTSINQEGTGNGYDIEMIRKISESVSIPVIAGGGAGNIQHVHEVLTHGNVNAACMASLLHYNFIKEHKAEDNFSHEGNTEFLRNNNRNFSKFQTTTIPEIKRDLANHGVVCRLGGEKMN